MGLIEKPSLLGLRRGSNGKWNFLIGTLYAGEKPLLEKRIQPLHRREDITSVCSQNARSIYRALMLRFTLDFSICLPPKINKALIADSCFCCCHNSTGKCVLAFCNNQHPESSGPIVRSSKLLKTYQMSYFSKILLVYVSSSLASFVYLARKKKSTR